MSGEPVAFSSSELTPSAAPGSLYRAVNYTAATLMDLAMMGEGLGVALFASTDKHFDVRYFYSWLALLSAVSGTGTAIGSFYLSRLSDRFGRKPMLLIAVGGVIATSLSLTVAVRWWHLFAIMAVRSLFMGIFWPSLEARITDGVEGAEMTRRLGLFGIACSVGLLLGPLVGGFLSDHWLRAPFFAYTFRNDSVHDGHRHDPGAADLEALAQGPAVRRAFLLSAWIANAVGFAAASILRSIFPRFSKLPVVSAGLGFSGGTTGAITAGVGVSMLFVFILLGKYHFWHYRFRYLLLGQLASVAGCAVFAVASSFDLLAAGALLFGAGSGIVYLSSIYYSLHGQSQRAGQSGVHEAVLCFGFAGGMTIVAAVNWYQESHFEVSHRAPYWLAVGMLVAGIVIQALLVARAKRRVSGER